MGFFYLGLKYLVLVTIKGRIQDARQTLSPKHYGIPVFVNAAVPYYFCWQPLFGSMFHFLILYVVILHLYKVCVKYYNTIVNNTYARYKAIEDQIQHPITFSLFGSSDSTLANPFLYPTAM